MVLGRPLDGTGGTAWNNSAAESLFATITRHVAPLHRFLSRAAARTAVFDLIEIFHNRKRRHRSLEMRTPIEFEKMHAYPSAVA